MRTEKKASEDVLVYADFACCGNNAYRWLADLKVGAAITVVLSCKDCRRTHTWHRPYEHTL